MKTLVGEEHAYIIGTSCMKERIYEKNKNKPNNNIIIWDVKMHTCEQ